MNVFKIDEFIKMAIKDEETGIAFYEALAETTKNEVLKANFTKLAEQEKKHAENFRKMLGAVPQSQDFEEYAGQYENYVNSLLESKAFASPAEAAEKARNTSNSFHAIDIALQMEKDTLLFYQDMKEFMADANKNYIEQIINEEKGHVRELTELKHQLTK